MALRLPFVSSDLRASFRRVRHGEDGHTVLEATIAAALLVTVLVPAVGAIAHVATRHAEQDRIVALNLAQDALETSLDRPSGTAGVWTSADGRWTLARTTDRRGAVVTVTVRVWRTRGDASEDVRRTQSPTVRLSTDRFVDTDSP